MPIETTHEDPLIPLVLVGTRPATAAECVTQARHHAALLMATLQDANARGTALESLLLLPLIEQAARIDARLYAIEGAQVSA